MPVAPRSSPSHMV
uniref:Uncharacterized protein n=1 Tax=Rhizophora mucronata TaxID=61149 RepID=A0A2P2Q360_RHIMU